MAPNKITTIVSEAMILRGTTNQKELRSCSVIERLWIPRFGLESKDTTNQFW